MQTTVLRIIFLCLLKMHSNIHKQQAIIVRSNSNSALQHKQSQEQRKEMRARAPARGSASPDAPRPTR